VRVLFVCSRARRRSLTAETIFSADDSLEVASAGTSPDAETPTSLDLIEWADLIFVMENHHRAKLRQRYGKALSCKRVVVLRIPDAYELMDPELIGILRSKVESHLKRT
jgi:predicted protein tyrosine phosphatase